MHATKIFCYEAKGHILELKTQPKPLLDYLSLDFMLAANTVVELMTHNRKFKGLNLPVEGMKKRKYRRISFP